MPVSSCQRPTFSKRGIGGVVPAQKVAATRRFAAMRAYASASFTFVHQFRPDPVKMFVNAVDTELLVNASCVVSIRPTNASAADVCSSPGTCTHCNHGEES